MNETFPQKNNLNETEIKYKKLEDKYIPKEARNISSRNKNEAQKSFEKTMKSIADNPEGGVEAVNKYIYDHIDRQDKLRDDLHKAFDEHNEILNKKINDNKGQRETPVSNEEQTLIHKFDTLIEELKLIPRYKFLKRKEKLREIKSVYMNVLKFRGDYHKN